MTQANDTIRVLIPLKFAGRTGGQGSCRPPTTAQRGPTQDPHILRAIGRAWGWRRRMEAGEFATIEELAEVRRTGGTACQPQLRLAYLAPEVLKRLTCGREVTAISLHDLCFLAGEAWEDKVTKALA